MDYTPGEYVDTPPVNPSYSPTVGVDPSLGFTPEGVRTTSPAPSEAFQMLANETRIHILLELFRAAHRGRVPMPFATLRTSIGIDDSARFAYHLRQLCDHYVEKRPEGYRLTAPGQQAATAVIDGTFTGSVDGRRAS